MNHPEFPASAYRFLRRICKSPFWVKFNGIGVSIPESRVEFAVRVEGDLAVAVLSHSAIRRVILGQSGIMPAEVSDDPNG